MLKRLLEQKIVITLYCAEHLTVPTLTSHQWTLSETLIGLLQPFHELTKEISANDTTLSMSIPATQMLLHCLSEASDVGMQGLKVELISSINNRFHFLLSDKIHLISTFIDPRFKSSCMNSVQLKEVKCALKEITSDSEESNSTFHGISEPALKKPRVGSMWDRWEATLMEDPAPSSTLDNEVASYLKDPRIGRESDPLEWWRINAFRFPIMSRVARIYLSAPASSVACERMFSSIGKILCDSRSRLLPEKANQLLFLKCNLSAYA